MFEKKYILPPLFNQIPSIHTYFWAGFSYNFIKRAIVIRFISQAKYGK